MRYFQSNYYKNSDMTKRLNQNFNKMIEKGFIRDGPFDIPGRLGFF